jgi:hypothetical protein
MPYGKSMEILWNLKIWNLNMSWELTAKAQTREGIKESGME